MAGSFDITTNPFHLLGISSRARMTEIAEAYEDALAEGRADEQVLLAAQKQLCAPMPRLDAELAWLHGLAPARAAEFAEALQRGDLAAAERGLDSLTGTDRANLAADLCARAPGATRHVEALLESYADLDIRRIHGTIAGLRSVAGFQPPNEELIAKALDRLRDRHAEAALACIAGSDHPGAAMTAIVESFQPDSERPVLRLLDLVIEKYDASVAPRLNRIKDEIEQMIACCREQEAPLDLDTLQHLLAEWDEIGQAVQLRKEAKSLEEPRSRELCVLVRDFCVWLANEKKRYGEALAISRELLATFPELPLTADKLREDVETLKSLAEEAAALRHIQPLILAREAAERDIGKLNADLLNGGFGPHGCGLALSLFEAFIGAVRGSRDTTEAELPWLLVRDLAIALNNEHDLPVAARNLLKGLLSHAAMAPSPAFVEKLEDDRRTIDRNLAWQELKSARGNPDRALGAVNRLLVGAAGPEREKLQDLKAAIEKPKAARNRRSIFWALAAAAFVGFLIFAGDKAPKHQPRITAPPPAAAVPRTTPQPPPSAATPSLPVTPTAAPEEIPANGHDRLLNKNEVRYCVFQGERIDLLRRLATTNADIGRFNALIRDFNGRCNSFRYRPGALQAIERELPGQLDALSRDASRIAAEWRRSSTPPSIKETAGAAVSLIDLQTRAGARAVQRRLQELGFYGGIVDGVWGPRSRTALRNFMRSTQFADISNWNLSAQRALMGE